MKRINKFFKRVDKKIKNVVRYKKWKHINGAPFYLFSIKYFLFYMIPYIILKFVNIHLAFVFNLMWLFLMIVMFIGERKKLKKKEIKGNQKYFKYFLNKILKHKLENDIVEVNWAYGYKGGLKIYNFIHIWGPGMYIEERFPLSEDMFIKLLNKYSNHPNLKFVGSLEKYNNYSRKIKLQKIKNKLGKLK